MNKAWVFFNNAWTPCQVLGPANTSGFFLIRIENMDLNTAAPAGAIRRCLSSSL